MKNLKRVLSMLMCIVMLLGMLPVEAFAVTTDENGTTVYEIGDSVWVRGEEAEPTGVCAPDTFWLPDYDENDQPVTRVGLCEKTEHTHSFVCPEDCALAHQHEEGCYTQGYTGCVIHTHDETCTTATVYGCGMEQHGNHDACTASEVCTLEEHDHAALTCSTEVRFTCEAQEHTHSVEAGCPRETVYTCGQENYTHSNDCTLTTVYDCGKEIHTHEEACNATQIYSDCVEHAAHDETCNAEQLTCGKEEHTCTTEGCAADCAAEEHAHTEECDMEGVYYKWIVVEDTSSTLENDRGLPIHFFIAEPGQAIDPDGRYVNYKENLWADKGRTYAVAEASTNSQINSTQGIRNVSNEQTIIDYVYSWPTGYDEDTFKDFGSMKIGGTTYSQSEYEIKWVTICRRGNGLSCYCDVNYTHIHIDGVLSKKITPAEMKLTKKIPEAQGVAEAFGFSLTKLQHDSNGNPTQTVDTSFGAGGSINLVANIPVGDTTASIVSPTGTEIGFGYYKLEEIENTRWETGSITIERSRGSDITYGAGPVYILIATDGTLRYSGTYNGTYAEATNIIVENQRKPLAVSYTWEGIPEGLAVLPETSYVAPGGTHTVNTSYPIGTRVRGTGANEGKYYEFMGWQYYDAETEERVYIAYTDKNPTPASVTVNNTTVVHGLWTEHLLDTAEGYITITKTFVNKPSAETLNNFYIAILHDDHETDISPKLVGTWSADGTQWTYDFAISESDTYTVVEGKYDVAGYQVETEVEVTSVTGISTEGAEYTSSEFISDGHKYVEFGQKINITLPYDTSIFSDVEGQADYPMFYAGTVAFTNTYTKKPVVTEEILPDFRIRKMDSAMINVLPNAVFTLTDASGSETQITAGEAVVEDLAPGTYTLVETTAPAGYVKDNIAYTVNVVTDGNPVEELRLTCNSSGQTHVHTTDCYTFVSVQNYKIEVPGADGVSLPGVFNPDPAVFRLNIPNTQIKANLNITKTFLNGTTFFTPDDGSILVDIYGPIVRTNGVVTDIGPLIYSGLAMTNPDWSLTVENLPYGEYLVEEIMGSIHGYNWTNTTFTGHKELLSKDGHSGAVINVNSTTAINLGITNSYTPWQSADFYILKEDLNGNELQGAKFQLFDGATDVTGTYMDGSNVTDVNGLVHFRGFEVAEGGSLEFTLKETQAPAGYYLTTREYKIIVTHDSSGYDIQIKNADGTETGDWNHADDLLTVVNTPIMGQITVNKVLKFENQLFNTVPDGTYVTFQVVSTDGTYSETASVTEDTDWSHTFMNLPLGRYEVREIYASINGHTYSTTYKVSTEGTFVAGTAAPVSLTVGTNHKQSDGIPGSASVTVDFENTYTREQNLYVTPADFTVLKQGENGEALSGATFTLYTDEACTTKLTAPVESFTVEKTTDAYGQAHFTGLKLADLAYAGYIGADARSATYYLKETKAPANHVLSSTVWRITITEDRVKVDQLNSDKTAFDTVINWITGIFKPNADGTYTKISGNLLVVENKRIKGTLTVDKTFSGVPEAALSNARVEVHVHGPITRNGNTITDIGPLVQNINLSGEDLQNGKLTATVSNLEVGEYVVREPFASIHGYTWDSVTYLDKNNEEITKTTVNGNDFVVFKVEKGNTAHSIRVHNSYTVWESADFYVNKVKSLGHLNDGLAGATFKLYSNPLCREEDEITSTVFTTEATTGLAGYAHFEGFNQAGTYYLKETAAPDNYYLGNTVWKVVISAVDDANGVTRYSPTITVVSGGVAGTDFTWNPNNDTVNVVNREILGSITIKKEFVNKPDSGVNSISVQVVGPNNYSETVTLEPNTVAEKNWTKTLTGLPMGTYYVTEQPATVAGYTLFTKYAVDGTEQTGTSFATVELTEGTNRVNPDVNAHVDVTNQYTRNEELKVSKTSFKIKKVDAEDATKTLSGAVFGLFVGDGTTAVVTATTDANGVAEFKNIPLVQQAPDKTIQGYKDDATPRVVVYKLKEITAPTGYVKTNDEWVVTVSETIQVTLNQDKNLFETIVNWIISGFNKNNETDNTLDASNTLTVSNRRIKGTLTIDKTFSGVPDTALSNARVEVHVHGPITRDDSGAIVNIGPLVKNINLSNGDWDDVVENLEIGEYVVREPFASIHGYTWKSVAYSGTYSDPAGTNSTSNIGTVVFGNNTFALFKVSNQVDAPTISVDITNTYEVWTSADFFVNKVKSLGNLNDGLAGATFKLYSNPLCREEDEVTSTVFTTEATTGLAGYAHFEGFNQAGTYYLKETAAPENYYLGNTVWEVKIEAVADGDTTRYSPTIKVVSGGVAGTDFTWNTTNDTLNVVNKEILADLTIVKEFYGDALPDKAFTDTTIPAEQRPKVQVKVTGPNGYNETKVLTLNNEGKLALELENLKLGQYTVTEDTVHAKIPGYDLTATAYTVNGQSGNIVTFTDTNHSAEMVIKNTYDKRETVINDPDQFVIHKKDDAGNSLPGAKFRLTNDHDPAHVREFITGVDGKVIVDNLIGVGDLDSHADVIYTLEEIEAPVGHELPANRIWRIKVVENDGTFTVELDAQNDAYETIWDWVIGLFDPDKDYKENVLTVVNNRKTATVSVEKIVEGLPASSDETYIKNLLDAEYKFELYIDGVKQDEVVSVKAGDTGEFTTKIPFGSSYEVKEVRPDNPAFVVTMSDNAKKDKVEVSDMNGIKVTATNTYSIVDGSDLVLDIIKVSSGRTATPLSGAKFELYNSADTLMKSYTSGKDGKFRITEIVEPGTYELLETAAPSGYHKLYSPITITATYDYQVTKDANNNPVIIKTLVATVAGSTSYQVDDNNDHYYGIKNTPVTEVAKTSDETDLLFWGGMTTFSLLCMAIMLLFFPRKKGKYQR